MDSCLNSSSGPSVMLLQVQVFTACQTDIKIHKLGLSVVGYCSVDKILGKSLKSRIFSLEHRVCIRYCYAQKLLPDRSLITRPRLTLEARNLGLVASRGSMKCHQDLLLLYSWLHQEGPPFRIPWVLREVDSGFRAKPTRDRDIYVRTANWPYRLFADTFTKRGNAWWELYGNWTPSVTICRILLMRDHESKVCNRKSIIISETSICVCWICQDL